MLRAVLAYCAGIFLFTTIAHGQPDDWYIRSIFPLASADLNIVDVQPLLEAACPGKTYRRNKQGRQEVGCKVCPAGSGLRDVPGQSLEAVTFGHFTSASSDDALLSVMGCEPHSLYFGGSFLLTKQDGQWRRVGYYPRLITEQCHALATESGRQIMVCAHYFGAQGLGERFIYALDFKQPGKPLVATLLSAVNGMYTCGQEEGNKPVQQSVVESVEYTDLDGDGLADVSIVARTGRVQRSEAEFQACVDWSSGKRRMNSRMRTPKYRIDYLLKGDRLVLAPDSRAAMARFGKLDKF